MPCLVLDNHISLSSVARPQYFKGLWQYHNSQNIIICLAKNIHPLWWADAVHAFLLQVPYTFHTEGQSHVQQQKQASNGRWCSSVHKKYWECTCRPVAQPKTIQEADAAWHLLTDCLNRTAKPRRQNKCLRFNPSLQCIQNLFPIPSVLFPHMHVRYEHKLMLVLEEQRNTWESTSGWGLLLLNFPLPRGAQPSVLHLIPQLLSDSLALCLRLGSEHFGLQKPNSQAQRKKQKV